MTSFIGTRGLVLIGLYVASVLFALSVHDGYGVARSAGYAVGLMALPTFAALFIPSTRRDDPVAYKLTLGTLICVSLIAWLGGK